MNLEYSFYPESKTQGFTNIDGTISFYKRVNSFLKKDFLVLDVGCGDGESKSKEQVILRRQLVNLKGKVKKVIGIDIDKRGQQNPLIDEFKLIEDKAHWPVKNNSVDLILADYVLEHFEKPEIFFSESKRVLKNKGQICIRTSNSWNYIVILAKLLPANWHKKIIKKSQPKRALKDVYLTFYHCNSFFKLREMLKKFNFKGRIIGFESEPRYLNFNAFLYFLGVIHQKIAPAIFRANLFVFVKKV
ncbi:MAG: class I SAM-dependent methyltransferase [Patescibacteria group bacterium]|nr:class I SAM-dependent methyltransferase [Patescibacteria group bacterium]